MVIEMINTERYATKYNFNPDVVKDAFSNIDYLEGKRDTVLSRLNKILSCMNGNSPFYFNTSRSLFEQFCYSCCHSLAEHFIYLLHDHKNFNVLHVRIIDIVTIHSCIELIWNDKSYFMDAEGIFTSLNDILKRYQKKEHEIYIEKRTSHDIINNDENETIRKLTELTPFWMLSFNIAEDEGIESSEDLINDAFNNIILKIIPET